MVIDCNNKDEIKDIWFGQFNSFARGSVMYGTAGDDSDLDIGIIVPDDTDFIDIDGVFDNEKCDTRLHPAVVFRIYYFSFCLNFSHSSLLFFLPVDLPVTASYRPPSFQPTTPGQYFLLAS